MVTMGKKQTSITVDERIWGELASFCTRAKATQQGVIEAAIYWVVHRLPAEKYLEVMRAASDYVETGESSQDDIAGIAKVVKDSEARRQGRKAHG